ncbi:glycosyltransferase [Longibacter sp.]|uniref:glycosyltransferase n=1 Tax=Longibacter sp. TaxID=2045415 RepID=UPI003EBC54B3
MNVGLVLPYLKAGGTERQARYIARHLQASGHQVTFIVSEATGAFAGEVQAETISLDLPFRKATAPAFVFRLVRTVRDRQFDVLLSRAWNTNMVTAIAGLLSRTPYVLFLSGPTERRQQSRIRLAIEGFLLRRASKIISVSSAARKNCIRAYDLPQSLIQVIHNGIRIDEIQTQADKSSDDVARIPSGVFSVAFVGRINHRKGLDILLRSLSQLRRSRDGGQSDSSSEIHAWVVGGGDPQPYRAMVEEFGLEGQVHFLGEKENPFPVMHRSDVFVLPSRSEGFPNVLLEAMALGRPVLAADCETGPNEIIDGDNGRLFPVEDHDALADLLLEMRENPAIAEELGQRARDTVRKNFGLQSQLSKIRRVVESAATSV